MSFQSLHFLLFALSVFGANALLIGLPTLRKNLLLVASYYFYMCWDWRFAGLLFLVAAVNYLAALQIEKARTQTQRKLWLTTALLICLGVLAFFKYANFFLESFVQLIESLGLHADVPTLNVLLPIGISFFTFQGISYTIDVYRRQQTPVTDFRDFALFIAFFPTVLSGPITRGRQLLPQLAALPPYRSETAQEGIFLILRGLAKKIFFADVLALHIVTPAFSQPQDYGSMFLVIGVIAYSFQIYMDLSGYTDIARGIAKTLGLELPENFNRPYLATSVSNFWQRWHISMSSFFRDYLYFGVGGSKHGNVYINLLITFAAIGMWHGAGWNFIVYGLLHGSIVGLERFFRGRQSELGIANLTRNRAYALIAIAATFLFVAFSRILFRSEDLDSAIVFAGSMLGNDGLPSPLTTIGMLALAGSIVLHYVPRAWNDKARDVFIRAPALMQAGVATALVFGMFALTSGAASFVYFQF